MVHKQGAAIFLSFLLSGIHQKDKDCSPAKVARLVRRKLNEAASFLFPKKLELKVENSLPNYGFINGGWADLRDHQLCLQMALSLK